ncbi:MAG: hypothetical protein RL885_06225 [Planctomycetota bacterium]
MTDRESRELGELLEEYRRSGRPSELADRTRQETCPDDPSLARLQGCADEQRHADLCRHVLYCDRCFRKARQLGYLADDEWDVLRVKD